MSNAQFQHRIRLRHRQLRVDLFFQQPPESTAADLLTGTQEQVSLWGDRNYVGGDDDQRWWITDVGRTAPPQRFGRPVIIGVMGWRGQARPLSLDQLQLVVEVEQDPTGKLSCYYKILAPDEAKLATKGLHLPGAADEPDDGGQRITRVMEPGDSAPVTDPVPDDLTTTELDPAQVDRSHDPTGLPAPPAETPEMTAILSPSDAGPADTPTRSTSPQEPHTSRDDEPVDDSGGSLFDQVLTVEPTRGPALEEDRTCVDHRLPEFDSPQGTDAQPLIQQDPTVDDSGGTWNKPVSDSDGCRWDSSRGIRLPRQRQITRHDLGLQAAISDPALKRILRHAFRPDSVGEIQRLLVGKISDVSGGRRLTVDDLSELHREVPRGLTVLGFLYVDRGTNEPQPPEARAGQAWICIDLKRDVERGRFEARCALVGPNEAVRLDREPAVSLVRNRLFDDFVQEGMIARIWRPAWAALNSDVLRRRQVEIGGYLLGRVVEPNRVEVHDACLTSTGSHQGVSILREIQTAADRYQQENRDSMVQVVGWWHTHPTQGVLMSDPDRQIHDTLFDLRDTSRNWRLSVSMVLAPHPTRDEVRCGLFLPHLRGNLRVIGDHLARPGGRSRGSSTDDWALDRVKPQTARPSGETVAISSLVRGVVRAGNRPARTATTTTEERESRALPPPDADRQAPIGRRPSGPFLFFLIAVALSIAIVFLALYHRFSDNPVKPSSEPSLEQDAP